MPADAGEQSDLTVHLFLQRNHPFVSYFNRSVKAELVSLFYERNNNCLHCSSIPNSHEIQQRPQLFSAPPQLPFSARLNTEVTKSADLWGSCWKITLLYLFCGSFRSHSSRAHPHCTRTNRIHSAN